MDCTGRIEWNVRRRVNPEVIEWITTSQGDRVDLEVDEWITRSESGASDGLVDREVTEWIFR